MISLVNCKTHYKHGPPLTVLQVTSTPSRSCFLSRYFTTWQLVQRTHGSKVTTWRHPGGQPSNQATRPLTIKSSLRRAGLGLIVILICACCARVNPCLGAQSNTRTLTWWEGPDESCHRSLFSSSWVPWAESLCRSGSTRGGSVRTWRPYQRPLTFPLLLQV